ncbi:MAG: transporter, partial [Pseudomonadota bacterium]
MLSGRGAKSVSRQWRDRAAMALLLALLSITQGQAQETRTDKQSLAKAAQNPIANLISVPFQNNTNFNFGPRERTQNILNIQPVIPITLSPDWNLITRTIIPIV